LLFAAHSKHQTLLTSRPVVVIDNRCSNLATQTVDATEHSTQSTQHRQHLLHILTAN